MIYFILDTNIWVYLANGLDNLTHKHHESHHFTLLKSLQELTEKGEITVLVNDIIIEEWKRNKGQAYTQIQKLKNQLSESQTQLKKVKSIGGDLIDTEVDKLDAVLQQKTEEKVKLNEQHIQNVEDFLNKVCTKIDISNELKIKIFDLSITRQVPFHNKKNNIADASILFSSAEYLNEILKQEGVSAIFITNNIEDFTDNLDKDNFHPELIKLLPTKEITFKRHLPTALKHGEAIIEEMKEFYRKQAYYESIAFSCQSAFCIGRDDFPRFGYLDKNIEVERESDNQNIKQIDLFSGEVKISPKHSIVRMGGCVFCGTPHIECPVCNELISDVEYNEPFKCKECDTTFEFKDTDEESGLDILVIKDMTNQE